jgi:hypothetical protein
MIDLSQRVIFRSDVLVQTLNGEALVVNLRDEEVFALNATGARIAQLIDDRHSLEAIVDALAEEYTVDRRQIAEELGRLVDALLAKGLVVVESARDAV